MLNIYKDIDVLYANRKISAIEAYRLKKYRVLVITNSIAIALILTILTLTIKG